MAVVTPTDHPKSVSNRCEIEIFGGVFVLSLCPFSISAGIRVFVIGLSQIFSFFSYHIISRETYRILVELRIWDSITNNCKTAD